MNGFDSFVRRSSAMGASLVLSLFLPAVSLGAQSQQTTGPHVIESSAEVMVSAGETRADHGDLKALARKLKAAVKAEKMTKAEAMVIWKAAVKKAKKKKGRKKRI
jgi:hypothetical protein